ncbi:hypothetical protein NBRC111894_1491 [Sporolactobacillus inulinus]|uniref:Thiamine-binding protein domain-containing protein n=1 Tax=Sporolactobacillus inulinus TaxID=2078 RepID=A0A4Y1ZA64_9BACL|nr:hypothetical protein NBRC111894_1491 [Sporolactobacillus inulinus]
MPISNVGLQILPFSKEKDTYGLVDEAIKVIQDSGVKYEVTALETILEGELDELLDVVKKQSTQRLKPVPMKLRRK